MSALLSRHNENYNYTNLDKYTNENVENAFYIDDITLKYNGARASNTHRRKNRILAARNAQRTMRNQGKPPLRSLQGSRSVFANQRSAAAKRPETTHWKVHDLIPPTRAGKRKTRRTRKHSWL